MNNIWIKASRCLTRYRRVVFLSVREITRALSQLGLDSNPVRLRSDVHRSLSRGPASPVGGLSVCRCVGTEYTSRKTMVGKVWDGLRLKDGGGTDDLDRNGHDGFRHWYRIARNSIRSQRERPSCPSSARLGRDRAEIQIPDHDGHHASSHNAGASGDRSYATMRTIRKDFIHLWFRFFSRRRPPARRSLGGPIRSPTGTLFTAGKVNGPARPLASP